MLKGIWAACGLSCRPYVFALGVLLLVACTQPEATPTPTTTLAPTATPTPTATLAPTPTSSPTPKFSAETVPLIDSHSHLIPGVISAQEMLSRLMNAGVSGVVLFGRFRDVQAIQQQNPDSVFPFAQVRRDPTTKELLLDEGALGFIRRQLDNGAIYGIGELSLRHRPFPNSPPEDDNYSADGPIALQIYDLAASYGFPVIVHLEHEFIDELERALEHNRNTTIIWAHMGDSQPPLIVEMMRRHPNLYADISTRNPFFERGVPIDQQSLTDEDGILKEQWRALFEESSDRFLFGIDMGPPNRLPILGEVVTYYRSVLAQLTPSTAEKIAYQNTTRLLGLD